MYNALVARRDELAAERQQQRIAHMLAEREIQQQLAQLELQVALLHQQRAEQAKTAEKNDYAYAAVIGELERLLGALQP